MGKILIVDDDDELRLNVSEILKGKGYVIDEAPSGEKAIEKVASEEFDIVLLDIVMPRMNGMQVLEQLKKIKPLTKVIMLTAYSSIDNAEEAIKHGASDYIAKPFKIEDLDAIIRRALAEEKFEVGEKKSDLDYTLRTLSNPLRRDIMKLLSKNGSTGLIKITKAMNIKDHTKLVFHLRMLKDSGIVGQAEDKSYFITKKGEKIIDFLRILENHFSR